ncbi:hypothetical protein BDY19DRAFT_1029220 [Irpex rosettiformis]|uniref:Uncharacterized protein n=1 Tax=Irpex rosettiformis TaxID=378272 RepID=A0ACB8TPY7_9APHY|nr:hypothetical protein BDY19DRAFT_1029220 [Irpex rosettiformis]
MPWHNTMMRTIKVVLGNRDLSPKAMSYHGTCTQVHHKFWLQIWIGLSGGAANCNCSALCPPSRHLSPKIQGCPHLAALPSKPYVLPKKRWGEPLNAPTLFTSQGHPGVPLKPTPGDALEEIDDGDVSVFVGCGTKVSIVIQLDGWLPFKMQKHTHTRPGGQRTPNNRAKVVTQVAEVMAAFMANKIPDATSTNGLIFGDGGIKLEDLLLLELRHVAKSSFQPIFGLKCNCFQTPPPPAIIPPSSYDLWLQDMLPSGEETFYYSTLGNQGPSYPTAQPFTLESGIANLNITADEEMALLLQAFAFMGS